MICLPNDKSKVINSPLLDISEPEVKKYFSISSIITEAKLKFEFELVEKLLQETNIESFNLLFLLEQSSNMRLL